jgi:hypothetical protein
MRKAKALTIEILVPARFPTTDFAVNSRALYQLIYLGSGSQPAVLELTAG